MKMRIKSLCMALLMMLSVLSMTACGSKEVEESSVTPDLIMNLEQNADMYLQALQAFTDDQINDLSKSEDAFTVSAVTSWADNRKELGSYVEILSSEVEKNEEGIYVITSDVKFEQKEATVTMNFENDKATGYVMPVYMTMEVQYSFGELMGQAGMNTLMGVGTVFGVLLFLTVLIGCFKFIGSAVDGTNKKAAPKMAAPAAPVAVAPAATENLVDDCELVAVIAAAIAAAENTSTDSFVVRSIRRKNSNKWSRA